MLFYKLLITFLCWNSTDTGMEWLPYMQRLRFNTNLEWSLHFSRAVSPAQLLQRQTQNCASIGKTISPALTINTRAPQGCVLSPFLCTLCTNDCTSPSPTSTYLNYSKDTAILALLTDNHSVLDYHKITHFTKWCEDNHLLNVMGIQITEKKFDSCSHCRLKGDLLCKMHFLMYFINMCPRCVRRLTKCQKIQPSLFSSLPE